MPAVETVDPRVVRDTESMALLAVDTGSLARSRAARSAGKKMQDQFDELDKRMHSIERLLAIIVNKG